MIVNVEEPVLLTVTLWLRVAPAATVPKSLVSGEIVSTPGAAAAPESSTCELPPVLVSVMSSTNWPIAVGANVTSMSTVPPGASTVPSGGNPDAENGVTGSVIPWMVIGVPPPLENCTVPVITPPTGVPPKLSRTGVLCSTPVGARAVPLSGALTSPPEVATSSVPDAGPVTVGVYETGTVMDWPAVSVVGSDLEGVPTAKADPVRPIDWMVTDAEAVMVAVCVLLWPTAMVGKAMAGIVTGGLTGAPKPNSRPSAVPT